MVAYSSSLNPLHPRLAGTGYFGTTLTGEPHELREHFDLTNSRNSASVHAQRSNQAAFTSCFHESPCPTRPFWRSDWDRVPDRLDSGLLSDELKGAPVEANGTSSRKSGLKPSCPVPYFGNNTTGVNLHWSLQQKSDEFQTILCMGRIRSHHFDTMVETNLFAGILQGNHHWVS